MSERTGEKRVYGEEEVGRILQRATELQLREPAGPGASGVTLAELEEIAAEAGIDPRFLRRAAREIDTGAPRRSGWSRLTGAEVELRREIVLAGELDEGGFERIVAVVERYGTFNGQPSVLGRTLTWRGDTPAKSRTLQLVVTSRDGETSVHLEENLGQLAGGLFGGLVAGGGIGLGLTAGVPIGIKVLGSALFAVATPLGVAAVAYLGARAAYRAVVARTRTSLADLFDGIVSEAERSIARADAASREAVGPGD